MNNEVETLNIELSPDNIYGYIFTTQNYSEENEDKRKKPTFFWKGFHMYPLVLQNPEELDEDEDELNPTKVNFLVCTEGGNADSFNYVPMTAADIKSFMRSNPSFRMFPAEDLFDELNVA